jgi:GLPGLI family protein
MDSLSYPNAGKFKKRIEKMKEYANNQKFELIFNKSKSSFKHVESLNSDPSFSETENRIARSAFTSSSDFYYDSLIDREISQQRDGMLIEKKNAKVEWVISRESKKIGKYVCYKATSQEAYISRRSGDKNYREVVAWFAPILPFGYGPIHFYGLPGLVLELQYKNTTYLATNIKLSDAAISINFPKGKTITKEEYDKNLRAQMGM